MFRYEGMFKNVERWKNARNQFDMVPSSLCLSSLSEPSAGHEDGSVHFFVFHDFPELV